MCEFAAALPLLLVSAFLHRQGLPKNNPDVVNWIKGSAVIGLALMAVGISDMILAVSYWASVIFAAAGILMIGVIGAAIKNRE